MVFILRDENVLYILGHNRTYTLGRSRQNDIRIPERSVSSFQAKITVKNETALITDLNSFHGTLLNGHVISVEEQLTDGDLITVGSCDHTLEFMRDDFKVLLDSNLARGTKEMLESAFKELRIKYGPHENSEDDEHLLTHYVTDLVTMQSLKNSPILLYLIEKMSIVTSKFFTEMLSHINEAMPIPNFYKFLPPVDEQLQRKNFSFTRKVLKANRRRLFQDIIFISFHTLGRLETLLTECDASVYEYEEGTSFFDTLYEMFPDDLYYCVLIHGPESTIANIKICKTRLQEANWKNVKQVHEDDLYLSILEGAQVGFKPLLGFQSCEDDSQPVKDNDDDDSRILTVDINTNNSQTKSKSEKKEQWISRRKQSYLSTRVKKDVDQVTSTTLDDDNKALNQVTQNTPEQTTTNLPSSISVKESSTSLTTGRKKGSSMVINPLAIKKVKFDEPLENNLRETPTNTEVVEEQIPKKLSVLQKKYKGLTIAPVVKET